MKGRRVSPAEDKRRRRAVAVLAGLLAVWVALDLAALGGPWTAAARYLAGLARRAGPTRDLAARIAGHAPWAGGRTITLRVWDWWSPSTTEDYARYFAELERIFEERHPEVDVVFQAVPFANYEQKLSTALGGDNPPDVFQCSINWAQGLYRRGALRELNDLVAATPELADEQFMPAALYHSREDERIFGIPHIVDAACLLWNLDMLRREPTLHDMFERGADGKPDFTRLRVDAVRDWEDFRRIARLTTQPRRAGGDDGPAPASQYGFTISAYDMGASAFMPWAAANGAEFQDRAGTRALFDTPQAAQALRFLAELYWRDGVCPPFRRQLATNELFQQQRVACAMGGTWDGKYIVRNTQGWMGFGLTAFPPGPQGSGHGTVVWANMMVLSARCRQPRLAWEYVRLVCSLEGALLRLRHLNQNSPRLDFYGGEAWLEEVSRRPYLANVPRICAVGQPRQHTQPQAVQDEIQPVFEYFMLNWPAIREGRGAVRDEAQAMHQAAARVNEVYRRYNRAAAQWRTGGERRGLP